MINIAKTLAFTGHRPDSLHGYNPREERNLKMIHKLREMIIHAIEVDNIEIFVSGMALGVDTWAARLILRLRDTYPQIKLIAAIPCANHSTKWNQESKDEWQLIIDKADAVRQVSNEPYTHWCMQKRNEWMVDRADKVIAVWNGEEKGGTYNCIKYAEKKNVDITVLNPFSLEIYNK